jgi:type II secretory pathway pseudopilin PulG
MNLRLNNKGQTLIEAIVAVAVSSIVVGAIALTVITGINNAIFSRNQNTAVNYARQGMEMMRGVSQTDWDSFNILCALGDCVYCLAKDQKTLTPPQDGSCSTANVDSIFIRSILIQNSGAGCTDKKVWVKVLWSDGKCPAGSYCHSEILKSCLNQIN